MHKKVKHKSVLLKEVIEVMDPQPGDVLVDATLGGAGHTKAICESLDGGLEIIGIEADSKTLQIAKESLRDCPCKYSLYQGNFSELGEFVEMSGHSQVDRVLFDLGLSTHSIESSGRGFSFKGDEPLDMRFAPIQQTLTARTLVNELDAKELETIIKNYSDERSARQIAEAIVEKRKTEKLETTGQLVEVIESVKGKGGKTHSATQSFQALRIAVNDEIENIKSGLKQAYRILKPGGILAVISFHGLETKVVRDYFNNLKRDKKATLITSHAVKPSHEEVKKNPKSRSAILRAIKKSNG